MRLPVPLVLLSAASALHASVTFDGITLHNGLGALTDDSAIEAGKTAAETYLLDQDATTVAYNMGGDATFAANGGVLEGTFAAPVLGTDTGVYVLGIADAFSFDPGAYSVYNGTFSLQLVLTGGLSAAQTFSSSDYVVTGQDVVISAQVSTTDGSLASPNYFNGRTTRIAYLFASFDSYGVDPVDVIGVRFSNLTSPWLDVSHIGTVGAAPVPEPSTYGLILGGLALAGAAIRRRKGSR